LRMRPDRIVVGECRGAEAFALLQALHTGHRGTLCTLHASSVEDAIDRFQTLVLQGHPSLGNEVVRRMIFSCIDVVVSLCRDSDGSRVLSEVRELTGGLRSC
jgi:pilus assembly protein CpaF